MENYQPKSLNPMKNLILFLFVLTTIWGCTGCNESSQECLTTNELNQAIVWLPESSDSLEVVERLQDNSLKLSHTATCPCNKSLQLWGKSTPIWGTTGVADNERKPTGGTGDDDAIIWSPNYRIYAPFMTETLEMSKLNKNFKGSHESPDSILIGIIDSGLKHDSGSIPLWTNQYERQNRDQDADQNGLKGDVDGWDFTSLSDTGGSGWHNDEANHGTLVTAFIADELREFNYKIMPLKVLDKDKNGSLFNAICAMEYARQQMVKHRENKKIRGIINLSWGYYDLESRPLKHMLRRLSNDKILAVAAAGNESKNACDDNAETPTSNKRDLSSRTRKFYPAAYQMENLIVATTLMTKDIVSAWPPITSLQTDPQQNYSKDFVDIGVLGDRGHFFIIPFSSSTEVWGSSIAAPITTAQVAKAVIAGKTSKSEIFNWLQEKPSSPNFYVLKSNELNSYIKDGKYTKRGIQP